MIAYISYFINLKSFLFIYKYNGESIFEQ